MGEGLMGTTHGARHRAGKQTGAARPPDIDEPI
jgi:hypothetical protein